MPAAGESFAFNIELTGVSRQKDPDRTGSVIASRFRVMERLGKGGMAAVYRAIDCVSGAVYAIKFLDRRYAVDPEMARRCQREARTMAMLTHPHIPRSYVVGSTAQGDLYIVMEFLRGRDLDQIVRAEGPLSWKRTVEIGLQLCDALAAVHAQNIIHRDVKPSNCFLLETVEGDFAKLIDFGIVRDLDASGEQTSTGTVLGTAGYLAPELHAGTAKASVLTDIYALGVTLYKLVSGHLPWPGSAAIEIAHRQQSEAPRPLNNVLLPPRALPPATERTLMRALEQDPARRYPCATSFAEALRATLTDIPDEPSGVSRLPSWLRRIRPPVEESARTRPSRSTAMRRRSLAWTSAALTSLAVLLWFPGHTRSSGTVMLPPSPSLTPSTPPTPAHEEQRPVPEPTRRTLDPPAPRTPDEPVGAPFQPREVRKALAALQTPCLAYEQGQKQPTVHVQVSPAGRVTGVEPKRPFAECVHKRLAAHQFSPSAAGGTVTYTFRVAPPPLLGGSRGT